MASTYTNNLELEKQGVGDNVDTWGEPTLNTNVIQRIDDALGKTTEIALTNVNVTLTQTQWRTKALLLTGTISGNIVISLPLSVNSVGSATAVGGVIVVDNQTTGAFTITVKTAATASTGVEVPQGYRSTLYSDTVDVTFADDQARSTVSTFAGNPNGSVAGTAGSSTTPASLIYDRTNAIYYICTTAGTTSTAVWSALSGPVHAPQGYLTPSSDANEPVLSGDSLGATRLYYTPFVGNFAVVYNGTSFVPYVFSQMTLDLTASQAANGIYDAFHFIDSGVLTIGFGPSWSAGSGGSVTPGSCVRGTGAGGAAIQRIAGLWVNTAAMNLNNGATTYSISAQRGTYLGTVAIDTTQGQVTCHRTWGQSRKFGVWNAYNRVPITLKGGDSTASWFYNSLTVHPANSSTANSLTVLSGLAEETYQTSFVQTVRPSAAGASSSCLLYVGWNSTTAGSGLAGIASGMGFANANFQATASYIAPPSLGIQTVTALEAVSTANGATNQLFTGTEANMVLSTSWRG